MTFLRIKRLILICIILLFAALMPILQELKAQTVKPSFYSVTWSPDGSQLAVSGSFGIVLYSSSFEVESILSDTRASNLAWSPDGTKLAAIDAVTRAKANVWDLKTTQQIATLSVQESPIVGVSWSADSKRLAVGGYASTIYVWDVLNNQVVYKLTSPSPFSDVGWSPDGARIAAV